MSSIVYRPFEWREALRLFRKTRRTTMRFVTSTLSAFHSSSILEAMDGIIGDAIRYPIEIKTAGRGDWIPSYRVTVNDRRFLTVVVGFEDYAFLRYIQLITRENLELPQILSIWRKGQLLHDAAECARRFLVAGQRVYRVDNMHLSVVRTL